MRYSRARRAKNAMMRTVSALFIMCACAGIGASQRVCAAQTVALTDHPAKQCALRLTVPANWTLGEIHKDAKCVVTAHGPALADRCAPTGEEKVLCDAERRIVVSIRGGSIDDAATWELSDIFPFAFEAGRWRFTNAHMSERDAVVLQEKPRKILYADYATREHYQDGTYCCVSRNWWAMVDLPGHRVAIVEVAWDFIAWDEDTMAWSEATDAQAKDNVEKFLRTLQ
jgi:hypothetical protein